MNIEKNINQIKISILPVSSQNVHQCTFSGSTLKRAKNEIAFKMFTEFMQTVQKGYERKKCLLGPIIAVNSPDRNNPLTPFNIVLYPFRRPSDTENLMSSNLTSTGGHFGRFVNVTCYVPNQSNAI